jgi:hypothetical protein
LSGAEHVVVAASVVDHIDVVHHDVVRLGAESPQRRG